MFYWPEKLMAALGLQRVISLQRSRFNPLRGFDPEKLVTAIEQFEAGYLGPLAYMLDALEQRDDTWKTAARKTKASVSRCAHQIMVLEGYEGDPKADAHKKTLEKFWGSIDVTDAFKRDQHGGRSLLVKQMMDAVGSIYATHEIVWRPSPSGDLSAQFIRTPLWMFENTTGKLRFLPTDAAVYGVDMPEAEWLVTVGDGVGIACAVAAMGKRMSLEDWLLYSERCGQPGLHATTTAKKGSSDWSDLLAGLRNYGREWSLLSNPDVKISPVQMTASGTLPYPEMVARMDKAIAALWRGADLSTLSGSGPSDSPGASLQGDESDLLEQDACEMISETLQQQVDRFVIRYVHGDEKPLAYIQIMPEARPNLKQEMEIDKHLSGLGVKLSKNEALRRYQRTEVDPDDPEDAALVPAPVTQTLPASPQSVGLANIAMVDAALVPAPAAQTLPATPQSIGLANIALANAALSGDSSRAAALLAKKKNESLSASSREAVLKALDADLQPLRERIAKALQAPDDKLQAELQSVLNDIPKEIFAKVSAAGKLDSALADTITASLFNGFAEQAAKRKEAQHA
jgi:hypothetical protein